MRITQSAIGVFIVAAIFAFASRGMAHCDTMDGPVVKDAKLALAKADVTPVLKWLKPAHEAEVKAAFARTMSVRGKGDDARELADLYFFETLVRVHRAGEGAPYTGLKPAGAELEPGVKAADEAIDHRSADALVKELSEQLAQSIRHTFEQVVDRQAHANNSVDAGRAYVEAYVQFIHYVQRIHEAIASTSAQHNHEGVSHTD